MNELEGWTPIDYVELIELIVDGKKILLTSKGMQLYYKEVEDEQNNIH